MSSNIGEENKSTKIKKYLLCIGLALGLVLIVCINLYTISTHSKEVDSEINGNLASTYSQNASLTFFPSGVVIDTKDTNGNDGVIDVWNSNISLSLYSEKLEIFNPYQTPMTITLSEVQLFFNEENIDMDLFFSRDTKFVNCDVIDTPSQIRIYNNGDAPKVNFVEGRIKYEMDTTPSSTPGLWDYNFKFWSQSEGTVKIADNTPLGYMVATYDDYSLKNNTFTLKGSRSILYLTLGTHKITLDNDMSISAETSRLTALNGFSGKISMNAMTNDSKITGNTLDKHIYENDELLILSSSNESYLELKASVGDYDDIDIELFGKRLIVFYNEENINFYTFNNVGKYTSWGVALVSGALVIPVVKKIMVISKFKERVNKKIDEDLL